MSRLRNVDVGRTNTPVDNVSTVQIGQSAQDGLGDRLQRLLVEAQPLLLVGPVNALHRNDIRVEFRVLLAQIQAIYVLEYVFAGAVEHEGVNAPDL